MAALHLGAGRRSKGDTIDHAVGVVCLRKRGDAGRGGASRSPRCTRVTTASGAQRVGEVAAAYELGDEPVPERPILLEVIA